MTDPHFASFPCTLRYNVSQLSAVASEQEEALSPSALGQSGSTQTVIPLAKISASGKEPGKPITQIDRLKLDIERFEGLLRKRDATIEAQCLHIGALYDEVSRLKNDKENVKETVASLESQMRDLQEQDWQTHSGVRKKRKFNC